MLIPHHPLAGKTWADCLKFTKRAPSHSHQLTGCQLYDTVIDRPISRFTMSIPLLFAFKRPLTGQWTCIAHCHHVISATRSWSPSRLTMTFQWILVCLALTLWHQPHQVNSKSRGLGGCLNLLHTTIHDRRNPLIQCCRLNQSVAKLRCNTALDGSGHTFTLTHLLQILDHGSTRYQSSYISFLLWSNHASEDVANISVMSKSRLIVSHFAGIQHITACTCCQSWCIGLELS